MLAPDVITSALNSLGKLKRIFVAYSGGVDSHVLLHLCAKIPELQTSLIAVYVHHGLQEVADDWATHCERVAGQLGVGFLCCRVNAKAAIGASPEEAARDARYQALVDLLSADDVVLLAQHRDDQLETVLLQLFRGGGLQGLAGMPEVARLGLGRSLRPLLNVAKKDILAYAQHYQLAWVEDTTNQSNEFDRNYCRNEVVPLLTQRWPAVATTVSRSAKHCANAQAVLQAQTDLILTDVLDVKTQAIDLTQLGQYSAYQQRLVIRSWIYTQGLKMPSEAILSAVFEQVIAAGETRDPELVYQQVSIRRYRKQLYCLPLAAVKCHADQVSIFWPKGQQGLIIAGLGHLSLVAAENGLNRDCWQAAEVTVRFRQGGEKIALVGRNGRQSLKNLCQEAAIPPWQRDQLPLVYLNGQLAAVADLWISRDVWTDNPDKSMRLVWALFGIDSLLPGHL